MEDSNHIDYYFCCNAVGHYLQWKYNDESLTGSLQPNIGKAVLNRISNYHFTTTLLSSRVHGTDTGLAELDSLLVISFENTEPSPFTITCSNEAGINTVTTANNNTISVINRDRQNSKPHTRVYSVWKNCTKQRYHSFTVM